MRAWLNDIEVAIEDSPSFEYTIKSLQDPSKLKGSVSNKFNIPLTPEAAGVLGSKSLLDPLNIPDMRIGDSNINFYSGKVYPSKWLDDKVEVRTVGNNATWFDLARRTKINELELGSDTVNFSNQTGSWLSYGTVFYPVIDYGKFEDQGASYPVSQSHLKPAVRVIDILSQGFKEIGYGFEMVGRIESKLGKCYIPTNNAPKSSADFNEQYDMELTFSGPLTDIATGVTGINYCTRATCTPAGAVVTGASGGPSGAGWDPGVRATAQVDFQMDVSVPNPPSPGRTYTVLLVKETPSDPDGCHQTVATRKFFIPRGAAGRQTLNVGFDFGKHTVEANEALFFAMEGDPPALPPGSSNQTTSCNITFDAEGVEYNTGVKYDISSVLPDWDLLKLTKNILNLFGAVVECEDRTVRIKYLDDHFTSASPIDYSDRQLTKGEKVQPPIPKNINFLFAIDEDDKSQQEWSEGNSTAYGSYVKEMSNGFAKDLDIEVDFAATFNGNVLSGLNVPLMRKAGTFQEESIDREPRILIWDGLEFEEWELATDTVGTNTVFTYPKVYFDRPDVVYSLAFDSESTAIAQAGSLREWNKWLIRYDTSQIWEGFIALYDDELTNLGAARRMNIEGSEGLFFIQEIISKKYGDEAAKVALIQI